MGQKVNPTGLRLGINRTADSRWYADDKDFADKLHEDFAIRKHLNKRLKMLVSAKLLSSALLRKLLLAFTQLSLVLLSVRKVLILKKLNRKFLDSLLMKFI